MELTLVEIAYIEFFSNDAPKDLELEEQIRILDESCDKELNTTITR